MKLQIGQISMIFICNGKLIIVVDHNCVTRDNRDMAEMLMMLFHVTSSLMRKCRGKKSMIKRLVEGLCNPSINHKGEEVELRLEKRTTYNQSSHRDFT